MIRGFLLGLFLLGIATVTYGQEDAKEAKVTWDDPCRCCFSSTLRDLSQCK